MPYRITIPAADDYPEESFVVEVSRKPEAVKMAFDMIYPAEAWDEKARKQLKTWFRKNAVFEKIKPPKKSEWWPGGCPVCDEPLLRNEVVEHIRGYHGVERKVEA